MSEKITLKIKEGKFKNVSFNLFIDSIKISENGDDLFIDYEFEYRKDDPIIKKFGKEKFMDSVNDAVSYIVENAILRYTKEEENDN